MKHLATIEGDGEQHHSQSSGSSTETQIQAIKHLDTIYFAVQHVYGYGENNDVEKDGKCYYEGYGETQITSYKLHYEPQKQIFMKQDVDIKTERNTYQEEHPCPTW
jgi:hypothetical protein